MRYLDLFAGVGGFALGIQQAYEDLQNGESTRRQGQKENISVRRGGSFMCEPKL